MPSVSESDLFLILFAFPVVPSPCLCMLRKLRPQSSKWWRMWRFLPDSGQVLFCGFRLTVEGSANNYQLGLELFFFFFSKADLLGRKWLYVVTSCSIGRPLRSMLVFPLFLPPFPHHTTPKKWKGSRSLKMFWFPFWFQRRTLESCFRVPIIPLITKITSFFLGKRKFWF